MFINARNYVKIATEKGVMMKHRLLKFLSILLLLTLVIAGCLFYAIYISPDKLTIRHDTLTSNKIPASLDEVNVGFFSDIYYMEFMNDERLDKMIQKINDSDVDILLFGGDLFANPQDPNINAEVINKISSKLSGLKAPLGKFFVLGDIDNTTPDTRTLVTSILYNAGFEDMTNRNIRLHNGKSEGITLIGLDNCVNGNVDIQAAFNGTSADSYSLLFTHTPDTVSSLANDNVDFVIAGHSLGGQTYLPIIGTLNKMDGAKTYDRGTYELKNLKLIISNGLGTTKTDMRLLTPPQFNIIRLTK